MTTRVRGPVVKFSIGNAVAFDSVPTKKGGGGSGRKSELLDTVRQLQPGQCLPVTADAGDASSEEAFIAFTRRIQSNLRRKGAVDFDIKTRVDRVNNRVMIYRPHPNA